MPPRRPRRGVIRFTHQRNLVVGAIYYLVFMFKQRQIAGDVCKSIRVRYHRFIASVSTQVGLLTIGVKRSIAIAMTSKHNPTTIPTPIVNTNLEENRDTCVIVVI